MPPGGLSPQQHGSGQGQKLQPFLSRFHNAHLRQNAVIFTDRKLQLREGIFTTRGRLPNVRFGEIGINQNHTKVVDLIITEGVLNRPHKVSLFATKVRGFVTSGKGRFRLAAHQFELNRLTFDDVIIPGNFLTATINPKATDSFLNHLIYNVLKDFRKVCSFHAAIFNLLQSLTIQAELFTNVAVGFSHHKSGEFLKGGGQSHQGECCGGSFPLRCP